MSTDSHSTKTSVGAAYPKSDMTNGRGTTSPSFPELEQEVLKYWEEHETFKKSVAQREDAEEYVFYDGPPFANGLPHYGHLLTGYVKDIVPRFRTMMGYKVDRRFGWDTHGLPAELEAEKQLGIKNHTEIDDMGLAEFNAYCKKSVLKYTQEWKDYVTRQGRWVDFDNGYKTLDIGYMESVLWAFKTLYDKGLIYKGFRVLPYSWAEHTPLSNQETHLDDSYKMRQDPALTVAMPLCIPADHPLSGTPFDGAAALIWTTTPWTLPSNLAIAVHPNETYVVVEVAGEKAPAQFAGSRVVLAEARLSAYSRELGKKPKVMARVTGSELAGLSYTPVFNYFADNANSFQILLADYVTMDSGTGVVHQAPAFGEDDMNTCNKYDIPLVIPVDMDGKFISEVPEYEGLLVFDANPRIIKDIKGLGRVFRQETIDHSYPHSWRSGEPLIYMALPSWFVAVTKFRDRMVELNHDDITWIPSHIRDGQFGKWLSNARDWNISRNRYWGAPIPVWESDDPNYPRTDVYGSLDELERDFGVRPTNLHRPDIDQLVRPNPDDPTGKSMMRRVPEVLDCWFESGSMPYAQVHYPFENKEWFESHYPGDFIVEYIGQTRGWFYTLHVLATALFDKPSYKAVVAHGIVLGNDGLKMSKSKGNYPNVNEVFDRDGSDAMRWFLMSSPILRGGNLVVTEQGIRDGVRQALLPLWNTYSFFQMYASEEATFRTDSANVLDRYILAKLAETRDVLTEQMMTTDIANACETLRLFIDALTNWYVRRSRARFWEGEESSQDAKDAFDTLYTVLEVTCRLAAPLLPFASEVIWRGLTGGESVHLTDWPESDLLPHDAELVAAMDRVRVVCSTISSIRKAHKLRVRLPLLSATVAAPHVDALAPFTDIIAEEMNLREVKLTDDVASYGEFQLQVNAKVAAPRLRGDVQKAIKAAKAGDYEVHADGTATVGGIELKDTEYTQRLVAQNPDSTAALPDGKGLVILDMTLNDDLESEGWAKDRIREIQDARRAAGLEVSDRISLTMGVPEKLRTWAERHRDLISGEVLAVDLTITTPEQGGELDLGDGVTGSLHKVAQ
ncbi:isoleucine--tRNA ligase [Lawsonella clevelandensis]|jgi:isoleucine--tRNA ligase|uniref:Isoleucine--tRNA ligase n=2 Tax=Bacteria TaxID=2 RepID=A0A2W5IBK8_9ACTN|nr:isoleucine--tRNA ligase [Lawsonella clevelandensis]PZP89505.1 MAG: isoleucine--tRNA ligase [Lawsonella clevelandensis]